MNKNEYLCIKNLREGLTSGNVCYMIGNSYSGKARDDIL